MNEMVVVGEWDLLLHHALCFLAQHGLVYTSSLILQNLDV